jgi:hypothetical protein
MNDSYGCEVCGARFRGRDAGHNRYLDPICPRCASVRILRIPSRDERLDSAVIESNCL